MLGRGCPHSCDFCEVSAVYGVRPRYKEPSQVIAELEAIYNLGWRRDIFVCDDNFIGNRARAREILGKLIPWQKNHKKCFTLWTQTSVDLAQDPELINLMTEANFISVFLGIETPDEEVLARTGKTQNVHNPLAESVHTIVSNGLSVVGSFMLGFDKEKRGADKLICSFVESANIPVLQVVILQVAPRTRLWQRLHDENRLLEGHLRTEWMAMRPNYIPARPEWEIIDDFVKTWDCLFEPSRFLARVYRHCLSMRPKRHGKSDSKEGRPPFCASLGRPFIRDILQDITAVLRLCWSFGLQSKPRLQFWRHVLQLLRKNPTRVEDFFRLCAVGADMFRVRDEIRKIRRWQFSVGIPEPSLQTYPISDSIASSSSGVRS